VLQGTAKFCLIFNMFFDLFNSKVNEDCDPTQSDQPAEKLPFGKKLEAQTKILDEIYEFVSSMRKKGEF
jgi:hypothetical protein